jgi:hypothetical protein
MASNKWTLERCQEDALKHTTRGAWQKTKLSGYPKAHREGWLDLCCGHMAVVPVKWTLSVIQKRALSFETRRAWRLGCASSYSKASHRNIRQQCPTQEDLCESMEKANGVPVLF